jgi:HTH-type transcriptional regulator/antitoxin HigA
MTGKKTNGLEINNQYLKLITEFPPRPIKCEEDLAKIQEIIDNLIDKGNLTPDEQDYLNVLGSLVRDYEDLYYPISPQEPIKLINNLLKEFNLKPQDLTGIFSSEKEILDILSHRQELTINQVKKLADFFNISVAAFFG